MTFCPIRIPRRFDSALNAAVLVRVLWCCVMASAQAGGAAVERAVNAAETRLPPPAAVNVDFGRDIRPLLAAHCEKCHGPEKQKGGWRVDVRAYGLKGGDSGPAFVPGKSAESLMIHLVAGLDPEKVMPPKGERLTPEQVGLLRAWIDQGAAWPASDLAERPASGHWSLQPLRRPPVPTVELDGRRMGNEIDAFVVVRLATNSLRLSPEADRATLIRRLSFDLLGLPPSPEEVDEFVASRSPRAYEDLVERLLASPHYGERWARHWLDVVRYTESQGFEYDKLRDNAWHYRDYVVRSFNEDKPYDRFMKEQVAGDVLEPVTSDGIVGASLLVCGPWDEAGNSQANQTQRSITREEEMDDVVGVVGQTFLGLTVNCARCHSHKFDPIPQEEYYRIKSVFDGVKHGERSIASPAEVRARDEELAVLRARLGAAQRIVSQLEAGGWKAAASRRMVSTNEPGPRPYLRWDFASSTNFEHKGELRGGAVVSGGRLKLAKAGAHFRSEPLPADLREKTLEVWAALDTLEQGGGGAISIENEDGSVFDAIVFGERQPRQWTAGSSGFARTRDLAAAEESAGPGVLVHLAIVYRADNSIAVFRNGEPHGAPYTPSGGLVGYRAGQAHVLLGLRHTGGGKPWFTGEIQQASIYDRALSAEEVASSYRSAGLSIPLPEILSHLSTGERKKRADALATMKEVRESIEAFKPFPVSYVGKRIQPEPTKRLHRGDVKSPKETVTPGAISAIAELGSDFGLAADAPEAERRLRFAEWLGDARNPLPARVMANRIWQFHFGQGLVATPNDFGVSGVRPTHRELLDWLAVKFVESGWSVKALHRCIVNSATYRQRSDGDAAALARDADTQWLWRHPPRRLEAEAVRDAMLAVSGQINLVMGGASYRPFEVLKFPASAYQPVDRIGPEYNRRTIYRMNVNSGKEPLLDAFDCPDPSVKTPRRGVTTTPLQALGLMNNSFVQRQADHLAERARSAAGNDLSRAIRVAYRLALGRPPSEPEVKRALVAARERSLASVCWALLNSTEFVYVR